MRSGEDKQNTNAEISVQKFSRFEELRYLIARPEFKALPEEDLATLIRTIKDKVYKREKDPFFRTERFLYLPIGSLSEGGFQAKAVVLDKNNPFPSREDLEDVMDYYGFHGPARFCFAKGCAENEPLVFNLMVSGPDGMDYSFPILSPSQARMLNLKVEGKTQKEIAAIESYSVGTVAQKLHRALFRANRYGFWQIWPESVEMRFSDEEYAKALLSRGRATRTK